MEVTPEQAKFYEESQIKACTDKFIAALTAGVLPVPEALVGYAKKRMPFWMRSAFQVKHFKEKSSFILEKDEDGGGEKIVIMDKDTGLEQYSTKWSDGLGQFLEIHYRHTLSQESLKAMFLSNKKFFQLYSRKRIYGFTGTLGGESARNMMANTYAVKMCNIPPFRQKIYFQEPTLVCTNEDAQTKRIMELCEAKTTNKQPVLVIFATVGQAEIFQQALENAKKDGYRVHPYFRDEHELPKAELGPGDFVIATNKAGRGTDFRVVGSKESPHGLHVVLSYLPSNQRIADQAFGRTSRSGNPGTGNYVIVGETVVAAEVYFENDRLGRVAAERQRITALTGCDIFRLDAEEDMLTAFVACRKELLGALQGKSILKDVQCSEVLEECSAVLTNQFARWLSEHRQDVLDVDGAEKQAACADRFKDDFCDPLRKEFTEKTEEEVTAVLLKTPSDRIAFGWKLQNLADAASGDAATQYYSHAREVLEGAVNGDTSGYAGLGAAYAMIKESTHAYEYRRRAIRRHLKKAHEELSAINAEIAANIEVAGMIDKCTKRPVSDVELDNRYGVQLKERASVYELHLTMLNDLIGTPLSEATFMSPESEYTTAGERVTEDESKEIFDALVKKDILYENRTARRFRRRGKLLDDLARKVADSMQAPLKALITAQDSIASNDAALLKMVTASEDVVAALQKCGVIDGTRHSVVVVRGAKEVDMAVGTLKDDALDLSTIKKQAVSLKDKAEGLRLAQAGSEHVIESTSSGWVEFKKASQKLIDFLYLQGLLYETNAYIITGDAASIKDDLFAEDSKYAAAVIAKQDGSSVSLATELQDTFKALTKRNDTVFLESLAPYAPRATEAKNMHGFLMTQGVLKTGGLLQAGHKYAASDDTSLKESVVAALPEKFKERIDTVLMVHLGKLQGKVRSVTTQVECSMTHFVDVENRPRMIPAEIWTYFKESHLDHFLSVKEKKPWFSWGAFAVALLGIAQIIGGVVLICTVVGATYGAGLISEGVSDLVYATMAFVTGEFSWKEYAIMKAISLAITLMTGGLSALAGTAKAVGSGVSRGMLIMKTVGKAAVEFAVDLGTELFTGQMMGQLQQGVIDIVASTIVKQVLRTVTQAWKVSLEQLYAAGKDFEAKAEHMVKQLDEALFKEIINDPNVRDAQRSVASALRASYTDLGDSIKAGNGNKWAKRAKRALRVAKWTDRVVETVRSSIRFERVAELAINAVQTGLAGDAETRNSEKTDAYLDKMTAKMEEFVKKQLTKNLQEKVNRVCKMALGGVAAAAAAQVSKKVDEHVDARKRLQERIDAYAAAKLQTLSDFDPQSVAKPAQAQESAHSCPTAPVQRDLDTNGSTDPDLNRVMNAADIQMLANEKRRVIEIEVVNPDGTRKTERFAPKGMRGAVSVFKEKAVFEFHPGKDVGHFQVKGGNRYDQPANSKECLFVAYGESMGRPTTIEALAKQRVKLQVYEEAHHTEMLKQLRKHGNHLAGAGWFDCCQKPQIAEDVDLQLDVVFPQGPKEPKQGLVGSGGAKGRVFTAATAMEVGSEYVTAQTLQGSANKEDVLDCVMELRNHAGSDMDIGFSGVSKFLGDGFRQADELVGGGTAKEHLGAMADGMIFGAVANGAAGVTDLVAFGSAPNRSRFDEVKIRQSLDPTYEPGMLTRAKDYWEPFEEGKGYVEPSGNSKFRERFHSDPERVEYRIPPGEDKNRKIKDGQDIFYANDIFDGMVEAAKATRGGSIDFYKDSAVGSVLESNIVPEVVKRHLKNMKGREDVVIGALDAQKIAAAEFGVAASVFIAGGHMAVVAHGGATVAAVFLAAKGGGAGGHALASTAALDKTLKKGAQACAKFLELNNELRIEDFEETRRQGRIHRSNSIR